MAELGFFEGQKAELLEGEVVVSSPQRPLHYCVVDRVAEVLRRWFEPANRVRMQGPLDLGLHSEPEPDVAVVPAGDYSTAHPRITLLVVEVSDTTLASDRGRKASLYARAGVTDYWIVNLVDHQLEVYRVPQSDPSQFYGHGYADRKVVQSRDVVSPLASPQLSIPVVDLLG
jgi:Uma2 family endonuclease